MTLDIAAVVRGTRAGVLHASPEGTVAENELRLADLQRPVSSVVADSRLVRSESLFVALPGERTDGHAFISQAYTAGARGVVVKDTTDRDDLATFLLGGNGRYAFLVPDPLTALQSLARFWRDAHTADVIGITGSIGKTTTKEILASVLAARGPVLKSEANLNTEIGLPLELLRLSESHRTAVLEMGMYAPGDIELLASIARPSIGIVTNVEGIHLERMGTIERIARAKSELVASLPPGGLAILNGDNRWTRAMAITTGLARTLLVGLSPDCDYRAEDVRSHGLDGISFRLQAPDAELEVRTRVPGTHTVHALLAAAAAARELGLDWDSITEALALVELSERLHVFRAGSDLLVIDDRYNAAPLSMRAALDVLGAFPGEKIAVLGDMLELGPGEEDAHRQVGVWAAETADWLVVHGPRAAWIAESARRQGMAPARIRTAVSNFAAAAAVRDIISSAVPALTAPAPPTISPDRPSVVASEREAPDSAKPRWAVLIKGSRGMRMEEIVDLLRGTA
jgi:UDP-N-acetylmuramoyl-tripeptide--D-alanyl-D-alanine ligase